MQRKFQIVPKLMWLPLMLSLVCNSIAYYGSRLVTSHRVHYNLSNRFDDYIPFVPWTIVIYLGCYLFWVVNYIMGCRQEREKAFRFMSADVLAKLVCLICFIVFPTTNTRPVIEGNSIWEEGMRLLYHMDAADNLFPSIHCLTSSFCFIAVRENERIPKWYKGASFLMAVSVYISTLTTKQHVLIDVVAGIALSEVSYLFVKKSGFSRWYEAVLSKAAEKINERKKPDE